VTATRRGLEKWQTRLKKGRIFTVDTPMNVERQTEKFAGCGRIWRSRFCRQCFEISFVAL
jgi:hypothetical protein